MDQLSDDGFWRYENGQWVPSEKQLEALSQGAKPYVEESFDLQQNQVSKGVDVKARPRGGLTH